MPADRLPPRYPADAPPVFVGHYKMAARDRASAGHLPRPSGAAWVYRWQGPSRSCFALHVAPLCRPEGEKSPLPAGRDEKACRLPIPASHPRPYQVAPAARMAAFRLLPGDDLILGLHAVREAAGARAMAVVTCVGSLTRVAIRHANRPGPTPMRGISRSHRSPARSSRGASICT